MKIAVVQLPSIGMGSSRLDYYIQAAVSQGISLVLLPEYTLFPFFKAMQTLSKSLLQEYAAHQKNMLKELAHRYNITIVSPVILKKGAQFYKAVLRVSAKSSGYYYQQLLIDYTHWNEQAFFANNKATLLSPMVFSLQGIKFAIMSGFEAHFDQMWQDVFAKNIDVMLMPSCATFGSIERWKKLVSMRAFTHNCYVVWANRIGSHEDKQGNRLDNWHFYGHSFVSDAKGESIAALKDEEALLIADISKEHVKAERKAWGFKSALSVR